jgi:hypothetical protein
MEATEEEYRIVAAQSTEQLLDSLDQFLTKREARSFGARPSPRPKDGYAREWFEQEKQGLQALVCSNEQIKRFMDHEASPDYRLVQTVFDLISVTYMGFPCLIIAELIARSGIARFCNSTPSDPR